MDKETLFFSLSNWGEYGAIRYTANLDPGEKRTIPLVVPQGRVWLVYRYRFGDITANTINFRFDNVRNYFEQNILITTELLNHTTWPKPYISVIGSAGSINIWNTDAVARDFSIVLDFYIITDEVAGKIRELVLGSREEFKSKIASQASTGGA